MKRIEQQEQRCKAVFPAFPRRFSAPKLTIFGKNPKIVTKALGSKADNLREKAQDCHEGAQMKPFERLREKSLLSKDMLKIKQSTECLAHLIENRCKEDNSDQFAPEKVALAKTKLYDPAN